MSPSPSGTLEVERYIGACLISNHNHQKAKQAEALYGRERYQRVYNEDNFRPRRCGNLVDGWAGGVPLISFVDRTRQTFIRSPPCEDFNLARLAVHTQGAPLILSKTYNHRKNKIQRNQTKYQAPGKTNGNSSADTVSVTSDESYGSTGSEQCLPRIIKPRKRRKKDRKTSVYHQSSDSPEVSSPEASNLTFEFLLPGGLESEAPRLHHTFEEVEDLDDSKTSSTTRCQCRYCDPAGQIWDVDKTSYSSFLTPPAREDVFDFPDISRLSLEDGKGRKASLEVSTQIVTSLNGLRDLEIKFFSSTSDDTYQKSPNVDVESC